MKAKILIVGVILKTYGGHSRFIDGLLASGLPFEFVHFNPKRPPKERSSSRRPGYQELFDAGVFRACLGVAITLYNMLSFPVILLKNRPEVVHFAGGAFWRLWEYSVYILICRFFSIRTIYHWLANFDDFYKLSGSISKSLIKRILEQVDIQIVLSELDRDCMVSFLPKEKIRLLPSGVSSSFITQFDNQAASLKHGEIRILFIGGRDPVRKGIFDILKALAIVVRNDQNIQLVLTGGGNVVDALELAANSDIEDQISFLGWVSKTQKVELYKSADMLLLPSYHEGLPYVILEAMAAGLPVISTPVGGIPDVIEENVNGFLVEPGDFEALANKILLLSNDETLRIKIGRVNRDKVLTHYSEETIFKKLGRIYDELCCESA